MKGTPAFVGFAALIALLLLTGCGRHPAASSTVPTAPVTSQSTPSSTSVANQPVPATSVATTGKSPDEQDLSTVRSALAAASAANAQASADVSAGDAASSTDDSP